MSLLEEREVVMRWFQGSVEDRSLWYQMLDSLSPETAGGSD
jgi:hypothetical protein